MKILKISIIFMVLSFAFANAQSMRIVEIDTSSFPVMRSTFYAFDENGNQIKNFSSGDILVTENGNNRNVLSVRCPEDKPPTPISSVLTIDVSGSMTLSRQELAKAAATEWIEALPLDISECAINAFNSTCHLFSDFSQDRNKLIGSLDKIFNEEGTNYDAGLYYDNYGAITLVKSRPNKRVVVFLTDGVGEAHYSAIVDSANKYDVTIYTIAFGGIMTDSLKYIATATGGRWFQKVSTKEDAEVIYRSILQEAQEIEPCTIEWESNLVCSGASIELQLQIIELGSSDSKRYYPPVKAVARLQANPKSVIFKDKEAGVAHSEKITISALNADFNITDIIVSNPLFDINPKKFFLLSGESRDVTVTFTPPDSGFHFCEFDFVSDICKIKAFAVGDHPDLLDKKNSLKLVHPNGGEEFLVGNDTVITWTGVLPSTYVKLSYSTDGGKTWIKLTDSATGLKYEWKNIPKPESKICLVRVSTHGSEDGIIPNVEWDRSYGGSKSDELAALNEGIDGSYYLAGHTASEDGHAEESKGFYDLLTIKIDNQGEIVWKNQFGEELIEKAYDAVSFADGSISVVGFTSSDFGQGNSREKSFVHNVDITGTTLFTNVINGRWINSTIQDYNENQICVGVNRGDFHILNLNSIGKIVWDKEYGGKKTDVAVDVTQLLSSEYLVLGQILSDDGDVDVAYGQGDLWLIKLDDNGNIISKRTIGGSKFESPSAIKATSDGGYIIVGITHSSDYDFSNCKNEIGYWVGKYDANDQLEWEKCTGISSTISEKCSVIELSQGGYMLALVAYGYSNDVTEFMGDYDYCILRLDENGNEIWRNTYGGSNKDIVRSVIQTKDGGFLIAGTSESDNHYVSNHLGREDYWIIKLAPEQKPAQIDTSDAMFSIVMPRVRAKEVDMGELYVGERRDSLVMDFISLATKHPCRVDSVKIETGDFGSFDQKTYFPYDLKENETYPVEFSFSPERSGLIESQIYVYTKAEVLEYRIFGVGVKRNLVFNDDVIDLGLVRVTDYKDTSKILIENIDQVSTNITKVEIIGPDKEQFGVISEKGQFSIAAGQQQEVTIRFTPRYSGLTSSRLAIHHEGPGSPEVIPLYAAAIPGSLRLTSDTAKAGEKFTIQLDLDSVPVARFAQVAGRFEGIMRVEKTILGPFFRINHLETKGDSTLIQFSGEVDAGSESIAKIRMIAGLGRVIESEMVLKELKWFVGDEEIELEVEYHDGHFLLDDVCEFGGHRLFNSEGEIKMSVSPNPAGGKVKVLVSLIEDGISKLIIFDQTGREIQSVDIEGSQREHEIEIDLTGKQQGVYFLSLRTPTSLINKVIMKVE
jgi:hypothetical protein